MAESVVGLSPGIDAEALRAKYRVERDKRMRADGEAQYAELTGPLADMVHRDPHAKADYAREPIVADIEVAIIGGGFSGLIAAARMRQEGLEDVRIIEAGSDFGGTWYWNRYPGAQCDIDSYCYLPLLEETGYMPKEKYSYASEIYEQTQRIARHFDLYSGAILRTRVAGLRWDDDARRWHVSTNFNDKLRARFVVLATGPVNMPKLPNIPGMLDFKGKYFHTSRWDYDYTGGDTFGGLTKLADKRVAIIGTGATAIQCVPYVGKYAEHLNVFQRTPSSVSVRGNKPTDAEWVKTLEPGWQLRRQNNFNDILSGRPFSEDLVNDGWTDLFGRLQKTLAGAGSDMTMDEILKQAELADFEKMDELRARVDALVEDPETAEKLKAWYRQFCKRPTFNDEYLPTFNRPNVTLVDTSGCQGVECITEDGVVANGTEYKVDCIIYATGFEISTSFRRRIGFDIIGRGGQSLYDYWAKGMRTFHGHSTRGFPNWFFVGPGQNGVSVNFSSWIGEQARHIAYIIEQVHARRGELVEATEEAVGDWVHTIRSLAARNDDFLADCTPGYFNNEGRFADDEGAGHFGGDFYAPGVSAFNEVLRQWREEGALRGLEIR